MSSQDRFYGLEHIRFESPYAIQQVTDVRFERRVNEHAKMVLTGIIPEEKRHSCIFESTGNDHIALYVKDGDSEKPLFRGLMTDLKVLMQRGTYYITVEAKSYTVLYDREYRKRSFQNASMRYEDLIHHIISPYPNSDCIDMASDRKTIPKCLVQYEETDWEFLKRLASHFSAVLIPDATMDGPKFFCGVPIGRNGEIDNPIYDYRKNLNEFRYAEANGEKVKSCDDFLVYTVESGKVFNMGDNITFKGDRWSVSGIEARMDGGLLKFRYELSKDPSIRQNFIFNEKIVGASLQGKVIDVVKDTVKIHLDIDEKQSLEEASWFPYSSFYTAEGNSGFYCMPEKGDTVMLYFPDGEEKEAAAMSSIRKGGGNSSKHSNPSVKRWGAPNGKELEMAPNHVSLSAQAGSIFIRMTDDGGIIVKSDKPLTITSKKDINIHASKKFSITAKEGVELLCDTSSITLDGKAHLKAPYVNKVGLKRDPVIVPPMPELDAAEVQVVEAAVPEKRTTFVRTMDKGPIALDVAGSIPKVGNPQPASSIEVSPYMGMALSIMAATPVGGAAMSLMKFAQGSKAGGNGMIAAIIAAVEVVKPGDRPKNVIDIPEILRNLSGSWSIFGKYFTNADGLPSNLTLSQMLGKLGRTMNSIANSRSPIAYDYELEELIRQSMLEYQSRNPIAYDYEWEKLLRKELKAELERRRENRFENADSYDINLIFDGIIGDPYCRTPEELKRISDELWEEDFKDVYTPKNEYGEVIGESNRAQYDHYMSFILEGNKYGKNSKERAEWAKQALLDKYSGFLAEGGLSIAFGAVGESAGQFGTSAHAGVPASFYTTPSSSFKNNATPSRPASNKANNATQKENPKGGTGPKEAKGTGNLNETNRLNIGAGDNPRSGYRNGDIDPRAEGIEKMDANKLTGIKTGSQAEVITQNPFGFNPLESDIPRVIKPGGLLKIVGGEKNPYFKKIYKMNDEELSKYGFELISKGKASDDLMFGTQKTTDGVKFGENVLNKQLEVILRRSE